MHRLWIASSTGTEMPMNSMGKLIIIVFFVSLRWLLFKQDSCHIPPFVWTETFFVIPRRQLSSFILTDLRELLTLNFWLLFWGSLLSFSNLQSRLQHRFLQRGLPFCNYFGHADAWRLILNTSDLSASSSIPSTTTFTSYISLYIVFTARSFSTMRFLVERVIFSGALELSKRIMRTQLGNWTVV